MNIIPLKSISSEILQEIFQYLLPGSLFNCALVDRQLCREIIPLLWKDPLFQDYPECNSLVVNTFIGCLSYDQRTNLRNQGIKGAPVTSKPTFVYATFVQNLTTSQLWNAIFNWLFSDQSSTLSQNQRRQLFLVLKMLMEHIFEKAQNIKVLYDDLSDWQSVRWGTFSLDPARSFQNIRELG